MSKTEFICYVSAHIKLHDNGIFLIFEEVLKSFSCVGMVVRSWSDLALSAVDCLSKILGSSGYRRSKKT